MRPTELLRINVKQFRGGLVSKPHRLVYRSTLGWRVSKKKKVQELRVRETGIVESALGGFTWLSVLGFGFRFSGLGLKFRVWGVGFRVWGLGFRVQGFGFGF